MSFLSRFGVRNRHIDPPNETFHLVHTTRRGSDYASKNGPLGYGVESFVGQVGERIGVARCRDSAGQRLRRNHRAVREPASAKPTARQALALRKGGPSPFTNHLSLFTFHLFPLALYQLIRQISEILHDQVLTQLVDIDLDTQLFFQMEHEFH